MSVPIRGNPAVNREEVKENQQRVKQNQRAANSRRPVLGNVTNQVRKQPQRVAKDKHAVLQGSSKTGVGGQENASSTSNAKKVANAGPANFAIFEDVPEQEERVQSAAVQVHHPDMSMNDQENLIPEHNLVLHDAVVGLNPQGPAPPRRHVPLAPLPVEVNQAPLVGSPMVVDEAERERGVNLARPDEFGLDPYYKDIYNYLRSIEMVCRPSRDYMNRQTDVTTSMRNILVDWLVEVGEEYKLHRETWFLAISYIDKFLSLVGVHRPKLQLVGAACMFIAAKYEEIYPPDVAEFVYITDDTYSRAQVLKMESVILKLLNFKVAVPTINWFCERFLDLLDMSDKAKNLSFFLTELSMIEIEEFLAFPPSIVAASSIVLARSTVGELEPWPLVLEQMSGYCLADLKQCVKILYHQYTRISVMPQQAIVEKYKQEKFCRVSLIEPPDILAIY